MLCLALAISACASDDTAPDYRYRLTVEVETPERAQIMELGLQSFAFHPHFNEPGTAGYGKLYTWIDTDDTTPEPDFVPGGGDDDHDIVREVEDRGSGCCLEAEALGVFRNDFPAHVLGDFESAQIRRICGQVCCERCDVGIGGGLGRRQFGTSVSKRIARPCAGVVQHLE